jgi:threonine synthase
VDSYQRYNAVEVRLSEFIFRCSECGVTYAETEVRSTCPSCAASQESGGVVRGVLEVELATLPDGWPPRRYAEFEFLQPFLPISHPETLPHLVVGGTPLLPVPGLRRELGMPNLWIKDDSRNPSGSTKDRASLLVVAKAIEYGIDTLATASTGNAASALAAVAGAAGRRAIVFVPADAPAAKLVQMLAYGATVIRLEGDYDDAFELCCEACDTFGWYNRNTAVNPFTIEGKKTAALEIAAQLAPDECDAVVVPTGDGVILAGIAKGFSDLSRCGLISRTPRLVAVQPSGSAAIVTAAQSGADTVEPLAEAASIADSLTVRVPRNATLCLRRIRESGGAGVAVSDRAIVAAIGRLARTTGVFAEPAGAAALAGLESALDQSLVGRDERVVLLITGSGLKDVAAATQAVAVPATIAADIDAIAELLDRADR